MIDLISFQRSLSIKNRPYFQHSCGGILTLAFIIAALAIFYFLEGFSSSTSVIHSIEYDLSDEDLKYTSPPDIKIIYGFPKNLSSKIKVMHRHITTGAQKELPLIDYPSEEFLKYFKTQPNPALSYFYHIWPESGSVEIKETTPTQTSRYTPTKWYCINDTGSDLMARFNEFGDVECFGVDAKDCIWGAKTVMQCLNEIEEYKKIVDPLSCGSHHLNLWGMDGYSSPTHWCTTVRNNLLKLNPMIEFQKFDETLQDKRIFMGIEQEKFNQETLEMENEGVIFSDIENPNNSVIRLKRYISRFTINKGFYQRQSEYFYSKYIDYMSKFIRPLHLDIIFHYTIADSVDVDDLGVLRESQDTIKVKRATEITFELFLDKLVKIWVIISLLWLVFFYINRLIFEEYSLLKYIAENYAPFPKCKDKNNNKIFKDINFKSFLKYKFLIFLKNDENSKNIAQDYESIMKILTIESLMCLKINEEESEKRNFYYYFKKIDFLSPRRNFFIRNEVIYSTFIGKIFTVLFVGSLIFLFYFLGGSFLAGNEHYKIVSEKENGYNANIFDTFKPIPFIFYYSSWINDTTALIFKNTTIGYKNYSNFDSRMGNHFCSKSEVESYNLNFDSSYIYLCWDDIKTILYANAINGNIVFGLGKCHVLKNIQGFNVQECHDLSDPLYSITKPKTYEIGYGAKAFYFDFDSGRYEAKKDLIFKNKIKNLTYSSNEEKYQHNFIEIQNLEWIENADYIFNLHNHENFNIITQTTNYQPLSDQPQILALIELNLNEKSKSLTREFPKFLILLKKVLFLGIFSRLFFRLLYLFVADFLFYRAFFKIYIKFINLSKIQSKIYIAQNQVPKKNLNQIFSWRNFFMRFFCKKKKTEDLQLFESISKKLEKNLSFEKIVLKNTSKKRSNILLSFDFLSDTKIFLVNGCRWFQTSIGSFLVVVYLTLVFVSFYFVLNDFLNKSTPSVSLTSLYFKERNLNEWEDSKGPVLFYMSNISDYPMNFVIYDRITEVVKPISEDSCSSEYFETFGIQKDQQYIYGCLQISEILGKKHLLKKGGFENYFSLYWSTCEAWKEFNAENNKTIDCILSNQKNNVGFEAGFYMKHEFFKKEEENIQEEIIHRNTYIERNQSSSIYFDIWENELLDDQGIFFNADFKRKFFTSVIKEEENRNFFFYYDGRYSLNVYQYQEYYSYYERRWKKINECLLDFMTIVESLYFIFRILAKKLNDYFFLKYYLNYYETFKANTNNKKNNLPKLSTSVIRPLNKQKNEQTMRGEKNKAMKKISFSFCEYFEAKYLSCLRKKGKLNKYLKNMVYFLSLERLVERMLERKSKKIKMNFNKRVIN